MNKVNTIDSTFPISALPLAASDLCKAGSFAFKLPYEFFALPSLVALSAAVGSKFKLEVNDSFITHANLYACLIANSGSGKTPSLEVAMKPIHEYQKGIYHTYRNQLSTYKESVESHNTKKKEAKNSNTQFDDKQPIQPTFRDIYTTDVTTEALSVLLERNPNGILIENDEFEKFYHSLDAYRSGKGGDRQFYMSAWSNTDIKINRKKEEDVFVSSPYLSMIGNMVPSGIQEIAKDHNTENGFLDRILFAYPTELGLLRNGRVGIDQVTQSAYSKLIVGLLDYKNEITYKLSEEAYNIFDEYQDKMDQWAEVQEKKLSIAAKLNTYTLKFALLLHTCDEYQNGDFSKYIDGDTMKRAVTLSNYFLSQQIKIYTSLNETDSEKHKRKAIQLLKKELGNNVNTVDKRKIQQNTKIKGEGLDSLILELIESKLLVPIKDRKNEYSISVELLQV